VTGRRGDLSGVVPVASGLGRVPRAERVTGELVWVKPGRAGAFLDDQRDGLSRERSGHGIGPRHAPEDRTSGDRGDIQPGPEAHIPDTGEAARAYTTSSSLPRPGERSEHFRGATAAA
jgi:hypothetical protein